MDEPRYDTAPFTQVPTPDGRTLEVLVQGDEHALPWLYHSGSPSAAVANDRFEQAARAAGLRLITYSRPGYGGSSPRSGAFRMADDVTDAVTVLDHLGADQFVTMGWSGGGPRALACAALLPDRCLAAATMAGVAPFDADGLDWFAGMAPENVTEYEAARQGPEAYSAYLDAEAMPMLAATAEQLEAAMGDLLTGVDRAALDPGYATLLAETFHRAARQGSVGMRDDGLLAMTPWGVDLAAVRVPVAVWQGDQDAMVPFAHGQWLATHVAGARPHLLPGEGHLSVVAMLDDILAELRELAGR